MRASAADFNVSHLSAVRTEPGRDRPLSPKTNGAGRTRGVMGTGCRWRISAGSASFASRSAAAPARRSTTFWNAAQRRRPSGRQAPHCSEQTLERQADEQIPAVVAGGALHGVEIADLEAGHHDGELKPAANRHADPAVALRSA